MTTDIVARLRACPIIQAPMAGVSTPHMAAEVTNAGALGSVAIGASSPAQARKMIRETRALTSGPFNVNMFCHAPAQRDAAREQAWIERFAPLFDAYGAPAPTALDEIYRTFVGDREVLALLLEERPVAVSFHFGLPPADDLHALHEAGIFTMATATCLDEARAIEAAGIGAIVAQGIEAGGHRGFFDPDASDERLSTSVLVRLLVERTTLPVIAAGGIMDANGIRAALSLGAVAAQLGTAFVLCPESSASDAYRQNLSGERARHTRLTAVISGRPARGISNRLMAFGEAGDALPPPAYPVAYDLAKQLHAAASTRGDHEFAAHWAGQGAPLARAMPARQMVDWLRQGLPG